MAASARTPRAGATAISGIATMMAKPAPTGITSLYRLLRTNLAAIAQRESPEHLFERCL